MAGFNFNLTEIYFQKQPVYQDISHLILPVISSAESVIIYDSQENSEELLGSGDHKNNLDEIITGDLL